MLALLVAACVLVVGIVAVPKRVAHAAAHVSAAPAATPHRSLPTPAAMTVRVPAKRFRSKVTFAALVALAGSVVAANWLSAGRGRRRLCRAVLGPPRGRAPPALRPILG